MNTSDGGTSPRLGVGESSSRVVRGTGTDPVPVPSDHRGVTTFGNEVVARIASQAASEVPHIGAAAGGVMGVGARRRFAARPDAECELYGRVAVLRLEVGCDFPVPLERAMADLRQHVTRRVEELTGLEVGRVEVDVSWLNPVDHVRKELS